MEAMLAATSLFSEAILQLVRRFRVRTVTPQQ